jgi:lipopolysaccharide assembly outer membrane protein LptD (OstA)
LGLKFFLSLVFLCFGMLVSAQEINPSDSINNDSTRVPAVNDSLPAADSSKQTKKPIISPEAIEYDVNYSSKDSMLFDMKSSRMYMHGNAELTGEDMNLKSEYIEVNTKENYLYAIGVEDSMGNVTGMPEIKDGSDHFKAKSIKYNFNTKKGIIFDVVTEYSQGFIHGERTKRHPNNEIHILDGKYTTCDLDHPHFYIKLTKAKVIPGQKVVAGPMYFVIADIPLKFIGLPFGFIPSQKKNTSGFIIPQYGEEQKRGFFLRDGGYFWAVNDYMNTALTFDVYSQGTWGVNWRSNFKKRYKFSGSLDVKYNVNRFGEKVLPEYSETESFWVTGNFNQDAKANPNSTFGVSLNFGSSKHNEIEARNIEQLTDNTKSSNITYRRRRPGSIFNLTAKAGLTLNSKSNRANLELPSVSLNMNKQFPFQGLSKSGKSKWYDKISVGFSSSMSNKLATADSLLLTEESLYQMENGLQYSVPVSASYTVFSFFNFSPSISYKGRIYTDYIQKRQVYMPDNNDSLQLTVVNDTLQGIRHPYDFSFSAPISTKLYGLVNLKKGPVKAIRHVVSPSVSFSYRPDFSEDLWGFYGKYTGGDSTLYSYYENGIYGAPPKGKSGNLNFNLGNNFEMKVRDRKDTVDGEKKIPLLKRFDFSTSYNLAADSMNWSNLRISGNTQLLKNINVNFGATFDPYARDSTGRRVNEYEWDKNGILLRLVNTNLSLTGSLKPEVFSSKKDKEDENKASPGFEDMGFKPYNYVDIPYADFDVPWSLNLTYRISANNRFSVATQDYSKDISQTLNLSGNFTLTKKWSVNSRLDYDIAAQKFVYSSVSISRDLHCWAMNMTIVPFGQLKSYMFRIYIKSSVFDGIEYKKEKSRYDY